MALHGHNESTHWITSSVIRGSFWSIRKYKGQQLLYHPHSFLIRLRAAIKEPFCLWQNYRWDGDLWGCGYCPDAGLWLTARRRWELFWPPRKRDRGQGKLYILLRVKGHLQRMMWQRQMVREACKYIYDALKWALKCTSCTLKLKWWLNLKGRILVHLSIIHLLNGFLSSPNNYGDKCHVCLCGTDLTCWVTQVSRLVLIQGANLWDGFPPIHLPDSITSRAQVSGISPFL